jgi:hypothetical protein
MSWIRNTGHSTVLWIWIQWGPWIRTRIQEGKNYTQNIEKKLINFIFLKSWMFFLLRAEVFSFSMEIFFLDQTKFSFVCLSSSTFGHQNPGSDPYRDPDSLEMLDLDPDSMNPDAQLCIVVPLVFFFVQSFHPERILRRRMPYFKLVLEIALIFGTIFNTLELLKKTNVFLVRKTPIKHF